MNAHSSLGEQSDGRSVATVLLQAECVIKAFHGVPALRNGQLSLRAGSVHALCGGNGAGKSTFLNIIMGVLRCDEGDIRIKGVSVDFHSPADALAHGVVMISQELSPVPAMTVAENLMLGQEPRRAGVFVDHRKLRQKAQDLLHRLEFDVSVDARMEDLSLAQVQLVEIAKALSRDAEIIIMDEPTSAIGEHEAHILFNAIRRLKAKGSAIIYVSHKLTEIFEIADEYTVFRDGQFIETGRIADIDRHHLVTQIVGHEIDGESRPGQHATGAQVLKVQDLSRHGHFEGISLDVQEGEVVGIYGLLGSGRTEFLETIYGMHKADRGTVLIQGVELPRGDIPASLRAGIAMVPEDRKSTGLILSASIAHNITISALGFLAKWGLILGGAETVVVARGVKAQRIKCASSQMAVESLSGGNQQKVIFARCLTTSPKLIICDEPTRGIDEGAKQEIYALLRDYAAQGNAVLLVSSEAPEVLQVSDRIAIFRAGRLHSVIPGHCASQKEIMDLAA